MSKTRIAEIRLDAERAVQAINAQQIPDGGAALERRDAAREAATKLRNLAREPITIGVVGEFSAGKSLLIGTLLGKPDLLPVAGQPVTGNITALRLLPGSGAVTEVADSVTIEYLTRERLDKAANHMVKRLREAAVNVPDLDGLADLDAQQSGFFGQIESWCRKLWSGAEEHRERNPDVLHAAWELMRLGDAVRNAEGLLGQRVDIATAFADSALDLGDRPPIPRDFPAPQGYPVHRESITTSREDLRATFPLIHRVVYRVEVPPRIWDLSGLRDENEVMLLDFPGLNSDASHNRDEFLSINELETVSTILIVVKGNNPAAKGPSRFYGMMQADGRSRTALAQAILVAGNRFDEVTAPQPSSGERVDVDNLASEDLRGFRTTVSDLTSHTARRCQIVSAIGGMAHYKLDYAQGSSETRAKISDSMNGVEAKLSRWTELAGRIEDSSPGDPWAAQLRSLGQDGGIGALRALIENHAREHGVRLKTEVLERNHRAMVTAVERFARSVERRNGSEAAERSDFERVTAFLRAVQASTTTAENQVAMLDAAELLQADAVADLSPSSSTLLEELRNEVVRRVYRWRNWRNILDRSEGFLVPRRKRTGTGRRSPIVPGLPTAIRSDTDTTTDLYEQFQAVVADIARLARSAIGDVVRQWVDTRNEELDTLRDSYADHELRELVERALEKMEPDADVRASQLLGLRYALDMDELGAGLATAISETEFSLDVAERFPLIVPHLLPWHPQAPEDRNLSADEFVRHQQQVFRMRRSIANAAGVIVVEHARTVLNRTTEDIRGYIAEVHALLPDAHRVAPPSAGGTRTDNETDSAEQPGPIHVLLDEWRARQ